MSTLHKSTGRSDGHSAPRERWTAPRVPQASFLRRSRQVRLAAVSFSPKCLLLFGKGYPYEGGSGAIEETDRDLQ
ncbi:Hypothetical predicted protein, partial [Podarcis lilfordi]